MFEQAFAGIAQAVSSAYGGPYHSALATWPGTPVYDDGGSIITPGTPIEQSCSVQIDAATEAMRQADGFRETDVRLLVIGIAALDTDATIVVQSGPHAGSWSLQSCDRDPVGVGWVCRGRRV